jgi:CheY-like chemotaxis protein
MDPSSATARRVAIIDSAEEVAETLQGVFTDEGWTTAIAYVVDFKRGRQDFTDFLAARDPEVIVFDIALPYAENWAYFQTLRQHPAAQGRRFVLTTTNERAVERLVGTVPIHEILGRPFDLDALVQAVRRALDA